MTMPRRLFLPVSLAASTLTGLMAQDTPLPLPEAPVRLVIPDAAAFDAALGKGFGQFLRGRPRAGDHLSSAWRQTQVGSKLEDQWTKLSGDLPWTWTEIQQLKPKSVGLAILEVGHLEAVLAIETPLAVLPASLPAGREKTHAGLPYHMITAGAADGSKDPDRRMGLAWARQGGLLILATSERALLLSLDATKADHGFAAPLPGLVSMELDLDALRADRYFRREFLFSEGPEKGKLRAALRVEGRHMVEVREGLNEPRSGVFTFEAKGRAAAGWEPEGEAFWPAFRRGLLEPIPEPSETPLPAVAALPSPDAQKAEDRYAINFTRPASVQGGTAWEAGELTGWKALLQRQAIPSWGWSVGREGARRLVFPWPAAKDAEFLEQCRATAARRAGRASVMKVGEAQEIQVGPGLPALALRRTGAFLWAASSAAELKDAAEPKADPSLVRWAKVDLTAVRAEGARWEKVEGPANPERVRPLSDRVLGLLGWIPTTTSISVERRKADAGWTETVVFGSAEK